MLRKLKGHLIKGYNWLMKSNLLKSQNKIVRRIKLAIFHNVCFEMEASFGKKNPDITFYVIRPTYERGGLFAIYNHVVFHVKKAIERNAIPIVDIQHYLATAILDENQVGKINAWELFFEQPLNYKLEEVYKSKNVVMSGGGPPDLGEVYDLNEIMKSHEVVKRYIRLNDKVKKICEDEYHKLQMEGKKTLGVICRGTDYLKKPFGHSIVPTAQETVEKILEKTAEWVEGEYDLIFLATEDEEISQYLKNYFGEKLIYSQKKKVKNTGDKWLCDVIKEKNVDQSEKEQFNLEYLVSINMLSKCDALIAPLVCATLGTMQMKGKYENLYLFQLGNYDDKSNMF